MLRLPHHWVWDSWVVDDGDLFHLFFLKAERHEDGMASRHARAVVGHATSPDLSTWTELPDALGPGEDGAFDDLATWTGSVIRCDGGRWRMFYTGISHRGGLTDQRIGQAVSDDLVTWTRLSGEPLAPVRPDLYRTDPADPPASETWRDPLALRDDDGWHLLVTARAVGADRNDDGVLGHAWSRDLLEWETREPLTRPGAGFGQLEVAQVKQVEGRWVLVFTCHPDEQSDVRRATWGAFCTWSVPGESMLGPWDVSAARPFTAVPDLFAAPLVQRRDGSWCLIGFRNREEEGVDAMAIIDPLPVGLDGDGYLTAR
ncbi:glycosyl hydrolase [Nocardioides oleivorans]|uniref:beta-fructofuranosidase n=1 Tax=Nocardioides oleivorans TaxID=273676 RepID=A0A4Q2S1J4_9ACTN|nr:glycosyl hydrolase [Nocardioides oleivorans]RYB94189.1 glycosyl hydrolase [Nocardioides oleivorans]